MRAFCLPLCVFKDHLGSILRVTNATGTTEADQSFDAWGHRRNPTTWAYTGANAPTQTWLYRGYTAHEHLDQFALINMNGRLYDPTVGRMLSPDNYVQDALYAQTFNRYAYAHNNPLKYVDPDGEWVFSLFLGHIGTIIDAALWSATFDAISQATAINSGKQEKWNWARTIGSFVGGAVGGTLSYIAPSFASLPLLPRYALKAGYAGMTAATSTLSGSLVTDKIDDGKINSAYYGKNVVTSFIIGFGISAVGSAISYMTWDRFSVAEKLGIISNKYGSNIKYGNMSDTYGYATILGEVYLGDPGLANRAIANNTALHELSHVADLKSGILPAGRIASEINAHLLDIGKSTLSLPLRDVAISIENLKYYGYSGAVPNHWWLPNSFFNLIYWQVNKIVNHF